MAERLTCPNCGALNPPDGVSCAKCGSTLRALDEGPTEAVTHTTAPELMVPQPLAPMPQLKSGARQSMPGSDVVTQIEDTALSRTRSGEDGPRREHMPPLVDADTALIKGRMLVGPVPDTDSHNFAQTTPSLPPITTTSTGEVPRIPWLNPWVIGIAAMLLLALGLLIGLLLS